MFIETKLVLQAKSRCSPHQPLLAPTYRWPGLEVLVGFYTDSPHMVVYILFPYLNTTYIDFYSWAFIPMGLNLNLSQGYQCHGPSQAYPCQRASYLGLRFIYQFTLLRV
jgi:hypothetical protein